MPKRYYIFLFFLFVLNLVDAAITMYALANFSGVGEFNPLFSANPAILAWKLSLPAVLAAPWLLAYRQCEKAKLERGKRFLNLLLVGLVIFYIALVAWNLVVTIVSYA